MRPLIRDGDWVEVWPHEHVYAGSVVLARCSSGQLVCHRVLRCGEETLLLVGDRSLVTREHARDDLLGVVRSVRRGNLELRLDDQRSRRLNRLQTGLHRLSLRYRGRLRGRVLEVLRRVVLEVRGYFWIVAPVAGRVASWEASLASRAVASVRRRPASSR